MSKTNSSEAFEMQYARLNPGQKEAVDTIEGPVMVIAGPGTGKTQVLTLRIANILKKTDVGPSAILALTFTNAAAANMRSRLVSVIGSPGYEVNIFTFHSFANYVLDRHPEYFDDVVGCTNASEVEQIGILREILDTDQSLSRLVPFSDPYFNIGAIRQAITHLKKEGISPEQFAQWINDEREKILARDDLYHQKGVHKGKMKSEYDKALKALEKDDELARVYAAYREGLRIRKRYDYDDSLLMLIAALEKNETLLQELQESFQYFLVDEHQDTNGAQNRILELLVSFFDAPNLFVVGDEKQAIFRFQGASLANFLYFEKKFRDVRRINLSVNYRSHQGILDSAHTLIVHDGREHTELTAATGTGNGEKIKIYTFENDTDELLFVSDSIKKKIAAGVEPSEIAVLFRNNRDARPLLEALERNDIAFTLASGHSVLDDIDIKKLNLIVAASADLDDEAIAKMLFIDFLAIDVADAHTIISAAHKHGRPLYDVLEDVAKLGLRDEQAVAGMYKKLKDWHKKSKNMPFPHFFEFVVLDSGFLRHLQSSPYHIEKFDKLVSLFEEVKAQCEHNEDYAPEDYLSFLDILKEHNVRLEAEPRQDTGAVRLMTAHKAKGLEFDYVYVIHAYDGHWGGKRDTQAFRLPYGGTAIPEEGDSEHDERRLLYVALTRARLDAYISYGTTGADGRIRTPSRFIGEIHDDLKEVIDGATVALPKQASIIFAERAVHRGPETYRAYVREMFTRRGLSPTALNHYLACPWQWFYRDFFRMQFVPSVQQMKGTAVHAALQDFFNKRNTDKSVGPDFVLERFERHLSLQNIPSRERERIRTDMREALAGYVKKYSSTWTRQTLNEFGIKGVALDEHILLSGKLDKIELHENGTDVTVVDYKTGKPKSRNSIEGNTKDGTGDYKRQLVFYKLLLDRYEKGHYHMVEGVIDFIEPTEAGVYKYEPFPITFDETDALEAEIRRVADEILNLSFWDTRCNEVNCEECALRDLLG